VIKVAKTERVYNIPLRKEFQKAPKYKRAKKAVNAVKAFLQKHMKTEKVKIGKYLNLKIWERGIKSPPHHVKVTAVKDDEGIVIAEIVGAPVEKKAEDKKKNKTGKKAEEKDIAPEEPKPKKIEEKKAPQKPKEDKAEVKKEAPADNESS